jgi:hypothetical protein
MPAVEVVHSFGDTWYSVMSMFDCLAWPSLAVLSATERLMQAVKLLRNI